MNRLLKTLLLLCFLIPVTLTAGPYVTNSGSRISSVFPRVPKTYDINLDASYEDQWKAILADFEPSLLHYADSLGLADIIPFDLLDQVSYSVVEACDKEFAEEMKAISNLLTLSFSEIVLLNFIYDFTARCTSILIQDDEGNVYHGRNLDFSDSEELSRMVFHGKYYKNGKLLYEAISLAGYSGLLTGMKPNAYSFSINQYLPNDTETPTTWDDITTAVSDLIQLSRRKLSPPLLAKRVFETTADYDELVAYFNSTEVVSNVFYIIAGTEPGQGTVMTKYRTSVENITTLNADAGDWYVVQTNYIGNVPDPTFDNRATAASDWLNGIGRSNITKELLTNQVLTIYPVFNNETIHTTIMQPKTGYFNTTIWGWQLDN